MQTVRRALILTHRYLGIPLSVLFVLWFVTGIAMIYVGGMPTLSAQTRLMHLPSLDLAAVRFTPAEAEIWLNEHSLVAGLKLLMGRDPKQDYDDKVAKVDL